MRGRLRGTEGRGAGEGEVGRQQQLAMGVDHGGQGSMHYTTVLTWPEFSQYTRCYVEFLTRQCFLVSFIKPFFLLRLSYCSADPIPKAYAVLHTCILQLSIQTVFICL